jgi:hypothetical protein
LSRLTPVGDTYFTWADGSGWDEEPPPDGDPLWEPDWPPGAEPEDALPDPLPGAGWDPFVVLVTPPEDADDDASLPEPAAEVPPPELREAQPASATSTTAVLAAVLTRSFIVLHLLADTAFGTWTRQPPRRFP